eukprot:422567-Amphidinium_carterae.1
MISGRQTLLVFQGVYAWGYPNPTAVVDMCCEKLGLGPTGDFRLLSGHEFVPDGMLLPDWPGIRACGEISEYQLVVQPSS